MCGIVGYVNKEKNKKEIIKKMADKIIHRGPDSEGYYLKNNVALGFRRLSIIDLDKGTQPIENENKSKVIIFNGEIYNYQALRKELIEKGHQFKTNSDTEVILHGYEEYQEDILLKLRGMFAFVIYDSKNDSLFGARDFYGIKPMYYYYDQDNFMFASEIKAFLANPSFNKELNIDMLERYLTFQYSVLEDTFFKNTYKLMPGHYFTYTNNKLSIKKYYGIEFKKNDEHNLEYWKDQIDKSITDSVKAHKISDVEVGSFLSSGVDSSLIVALADVDKTFTVGWDNKNYSEIDYAKEFSKNIGVSNISKKITKKEYFDNFAKIQYYMDEPLADPSAIALYFVANLASKHVKVALSGEGADEIFGGYNIYQEPYSVSWYYKIPYCLRRTIGFLATPFKNHKGFNFLIRRSYKLKDKYVGNAFIFDDQEINKVLSYKKIKKSYKEITKPFYEKTKQYDEVTTMQYIDFNFWLIGDILLKADKMSMANSLEVRVPYLDKVVIDKMVELPTKYKVTKTETKYAFRCFAKSKLENKVASKKKLGFPVPIRVWLKEEDVYQKVKEEMQNGGQFFKTKYLLKLLDDHKQGKRDNSRKIWTIYTFLVWYKEYFN